MFEKGDRVFVTGVTHTKERFGLADRMVKLIGKEATIKSMGRQNGSPLAWIEEDGGIWAWDPRDFAENSVEIPGIGKIKLRRRACR